MAGSDKLIGVHGLGFIFTSRNLPPKDLAFCHRMHPQSHTLLGNVLRFELNGQRAGDGGLGRLRFDQQRTARAWPGRCTTETIRADAG